MNGTVMKRGGGGGERDGREQDIQSGWSSC